MRSLRPGGFASRGRVAENGDAASAAGAQTLQDLDSGRLARAVRAEKAEYLAGVDFEVEAFDGGEVAVVFGQGTDFDQRLREARVSVESGIR